jgi:hypothetical protein
MSNTSSVFLPRFHYTHAMARDLGLIEAARAVTVVGKTQTEMQQEVRNYWRALERIEEQLEAIANPLRSSSGNSSPAGAARRWRCYRGGCNAIAGRNRRIG